MSIGGGDAVSAGSGRDKRDQVPRRRYQLGDVAAPKGTGAFLEREVATIGRAVLDARMAAVQEQTFRGVSPFTRQAGDAVDDLMFDMHADPSITAKFEDWWQAGQSSDR